MSRLKGGEVFLLTHASARMGHLLHSNGRRVRQKQADVMLAGAVYDESAGLA